MLLCAAALLAAAGPVRAAEHDAALWSVGTLRVPLTERLSWHLTGQARWVDEIDTFERGVVRSWLSLSLPRRFGAALGYDAHIFDNPRSTVEQRFWQQLAHSVTWGPVTTRTQGRLEERFFEGVDKVAWRARFLVGWTIDLPRSFQAVVQNDFFVNLNENRRVTYRGLGEDQLFVGVRRPLGRGLRLEAGYLMQFLERRGRDLFNHTLVLGFAYSAPPLGRLWGGGR